MSTPKPLEILFKQVDGLDIYADVYLPSAATKEKPAPVLLWWHGGGLLQGTRKGITPHLLRAPEKHGICVVAADYRLAPQTRLPGILSDCAAVISYLHSPAFDSAAGGRADTKNKLIVSGSSAGGFLALMAGTGIGYTAAGVPVPPPVQGIAAIYPITDLLDSFWTTKQRPVSYMPRVILDEEVATYVDPNSPKTCFSPVDSPRSIFYSYMVQEGILSSLLLDGTGIDPASFSIAPNLKSGPFKVPPTFLVHGTVDDKVPQQQATDVYEVLKATPGAVVDYEVREGLNHLFDIDGAEEMERMYAFIDRL